MSNLELNRTQYLEFEKLTLGAFDPLNAFMNEEQFLTVVESMRLPTGDVFPLPVVLDVSAEQARALKGSRDIALHHAGTHVGYLHLDDVFTCDKSRVAPLVFGTDDDAHPGVRFFNLAGDYFLGGRVTLERRAHSPESMGELTPAQTRAEFARRGWTTVAGFQTRNVPHRAHEYLQRVALEHVDGLFIQPLIGRKKKGDYTPGAIIQSYQALIDGFYPRDNVILGVLTTAMRYAGPREAVFHALIRRNYGCTHFIVGRDHAGVGDYYDKYAAHDLTRQFDDELGITIMRLHGPYHCRLCDGIVTEKTCPHELSEPGEVTHISGTDMRAMLTGGGQPPRHLMRREVLESVKGVTLFIEEDDA
ncbi:MAG: sulfate adenylyltransferase [Chromatiales bacterium]|jgi:sulfate adenylyltransferase|nr:sulfate adenylyltransferase [Chromatiales bacterium]